eukprot:13812637-Alexandrium_andersonii.AAC.1
MVGDPVEAVPPQTEEPSGPWSGDAPPDHPLKEQLFRRIDGVWVTRDSAGRGYPVDRYGGRWTKQRLKGAKNPEHKRPAEFHTD